jgi:predicted deacetylase
VLITPIVQRKTETEERFLTERESWEALNETWAVFVGWVTWNQLDVTRGAGRAMLKPGKNREEWLRRLKRADSEGTLHGYYEPEDPAERGITHKRFLAPASRLSQQEARVLMDAALGLPPDLVKDAMKIFAATATRSRVLSTCK